MNDHEQFIAWLIEHNACGSGIEFAKTCQSPREVWNTCPRGDWLLWWIAQDIEKGGEIHRRVVLLVCRLWEERMARYVPDGETRPQQAIDAARAWATDPTDENLSAAGYAAWAAGDAGDAGYVAGYVGYVARDVGDVWYVAGYVGDVGAAAWCAGAAAWCAARAAEDRYWTNAVRAEFSFDEIYQGGRP